MIEMIEMIVTLEQTEQEAKNGEELIRCKDCVWHCDTNCALHSRGVPMHDNDYCSRAERK